MLLFLLIFKNYRIQDATYSEVDSKTSVKSTASLTANTGGKHRVVGRHMAWSREPLAEQKLVRSSPEPSSLSLLLALVNPKAVTQGTPCDTFSAKHGVYTFLNDAT